MKEEIGALVEDEKCSMKLIGTITTDSRSMCDKVDIVQVEIHSYDNSLRNERIISFKELSLEELKEYIISNKINDSFTIQAFALWYFNKNMNL